MLLLRAQEAVMVLPSGSSTPALVRMKLIGAASTSASQPENLLPSVSHYYIGDDPKQWHPNVPNYERVKFEQVYPGIDLVYYGNQQSLEYDFVLRPGAEPNKIRLAYSGADSMHMDTDGDLILNVQGKELRQRRPLVYQEIGGKRVEVVGRYELTKRTREVRFAVAHYDRSKPLIVDPVLVYSTYLGGASVDVGSAIAVDGTGAAYVTGFTSGSFPTLNAEQNTYGGGMTDAFVSKLSPSGALVYSTYLGGTDNDVGTGIAVDGMGAAYATGSARGGFPTLNAQQNTFGGGTYDAFVAKLAPTGALVYATYLGGSGDDFGLGIAVDGTGAAYVTGQTSGGFPTLNAEQNTYGGGFSDAFVAKLSPSGALVYSTYLGGTGTDYGSGIAVDSTGAVCVTGSTGGGFPTLNAEQNTFGGIADAFVTRLGPTGALVYSTYLGGVGSDGANGIAVDSNGAAYVAGYTTGAFPTLNAEQNTYGGGSDDAFVAKLSPIGALVYSTFLGGTGNDVAGAIAVDSAGVAYVTGSTDGGFPTLNAVQNNYGGGSSDAFVAKLNPSGALVYSTYLGGTGRESGRGIATDGFGAGYLVGVTDGGFPTLNATQASFGGGSDAFIVKLSGNPAPALNVTKTHAGNFAQGQQNATYMVTVSNAGTVPSSGVVTVTDTVPAGFTLVSIMGAGWSCSSNTCNRSDVLAAGGSYQQITVTVNVKANATSPQVNHVDVTGGGSFGAGADDSTTVVPAPVLNIAKTHTGNFTQGQVGAIYTVTVSNAGNAGNSGTVTVTETAPTGLTVISMAGAGWACNTATCTRSDALAGGSSYPSITVTVNVAGNAGSPLLNQVSASGGGSAMANASDSTIVNTQPILSVNRKVLNYGISGSLATSSQTVLVTITGGVNVAWTAVSDHSNITVNPGAGAGTGTFQITATAGSSGTVTVTAAGAANSGQTITVNIASVTPMLPFGSFDTPVNNTTGVVGAIPVTGWALDNIEVTRVDILREPVVGEPAGNLIFIGTAVFVADARPDLQALFPAFPYQYRAGWGYQMLTNFLPNASGSGPSGNGTYKLHAIAFNSAGSQLDLGTKAITVDNAHATKPFGTIDTPGQGGTISGADFVNFGWALTPLPAMIPTDGSTITVVIDGVSVGHPVYNNFRSDIANLFPGYANSGGAVGFFHVNTTTLANGVHTISWNAFDNQGRGEGLGSRYFNVLNIGGGGVAALEDVIDESVARFGVRVRQGLAINREPDPIAPDADGRYSVTMEEVGHIELHLGAASGKMLVLGEAHSLPTGSTLKGGVFYWQPGPGFLGDYTLVFKRRDGTELQVHLKIRPKTYSQ